ncbi:hypothetical protein CABS03_10678 [Colletotrichum abscissum]|uniref:Uncharacterized protein n=2 Tax=Colletotrichum acutatum species complex TaxID=2707335 RepID=A0A9Q0AYP1_9PEZI|nr:hypothetical protein CABS02_14004 [Colletotrichum abscissum]KAK0368354.1 hypothetical protein CLIM01_14285 [Colletotrichum limetticola]
MASTSTTQSIPTLRSSIIERGYFVSEDLSLGEHVKQMEDNATPFASASGLQFAETNVLRHPIIRPLLESLLETSSLGLYRSLGPSPFDYVFNSDPGHEVEIIMVMIWSPGSNFTCWAGSHRHWLEPIEAANSLLQVTRARLQSRGSTPVETTFEKGGFAVIDARTAFQITAGTAITFAFGKEDAAKLWRPMQLPRSLEHHVTSMESRTLRINVTYAEEG